MNATVRNLFLAGISILGGVADAAVFVRTAELTLFVQTPGLTDDGAADRLAADAEARGGYLKERNGSRVVLRVPTEKLDDFIARASTLGLVAERKLVATDVTEEQRMTEAGLASREKMLTQYLSSLGATGNREDLATIQVASSQLIAEIEGAKGKLRALAHRSTYATVDVSFQKRDRTEVKASPRHRTTFAWLDTVAVDSLLSDFSREVEK